MHWTAFTAWRQLFPRIRGGGRGRFCLPLNFFTTLAVMGVALGVCVLVCAVGVMNGFQQAIRTSLRSAGGDIRVAHQSGFIAGATQLAQQLEARPGILAASPYMQGIVMATHAGRPAFPTILSITPYAPTQALNIETLLQPGSLGLEELDDGRAYLSAGLASALGANVGSTLQLYTPRMVNELETGQLLLPRSIEVAGIFATGWGEVDANTCILTTRLMQDLYGLGEDETHGIFLRLNPETAANEYQAGKIAARLQTRLGNQYTVQTWAEASAGFLRILAFERIMIFLLSACILAVAAFSISSTLVTQVVMRTRQIALLGAIGATRKEIAALFTLQALFVGTVGTALGLALSWLLLHYRDAVLGAVFSAIGAEDALSAFYRVGSLPVHLTTTDILTITATALALSFFAGLLPAIRAARISPANALREHSF